MKPFANNFLNLNLNNNQIDYPKISAKMAALYLSCFKNSKTHFNKIDMLSFLKDCKTHVFYNEVSLSIIQLSGEEADLITLLVKPNQQNKGFGAKLLNLTLLYLKQLGIENLYLEVAVDNKAALKLYENLGFNRCGSRKNYYLEDNGKSKDASILEFNLSRKNGILDKKKLQRLYPTG